MKIRLYYIIAFAMATMLSVGCQRSTKYADDGGENPAEKDPATKPTTENPGASTDYTDATTANNSSADNSSDAGPSITKPGDSSSSSSGSVSSNNSGGEDGLTTDANRTINNGRDDPNKSSGIDCADGSSVTEAMIQQWYSQASANGNANMRYVYVPVDLLKNKDGANMARIGFFKTINHTAMQNSDIVIGEDVSEGHCALWAIDVSKFWGNDGVRKWNVVASGRGKSPFSPAPAIAAKAFPADAPAPMDQAAYNMAYGNIYNVLIDTPAQEGQLRRQFNINNEVKAWGAMADGIVFGPRIWWMRSNNLGQEYWTSGDNFFGKDGEALPYNQNQLPTFKRGQGGAQLSAWGTHASEAWIQMGNGFVAYYIWGNANQERSKAEKSFVIDPNNKRTRDLITGRSCITCHMQGTQAATNELDGPGSRWTPNTTLSQMYSGTRQRFRTAMRKVVEAVSNGTKQFNESVINGAFRVEPLNFLVERVERTGDGTVNFITDADLDGPGRHAGGGTNNNQQQQQQQQQPSGAGSGGGW